MTMKSTVWVASFEGPAEMFVAQPFTVCAPASSFTVWLAPLVKLGTSFTSVHGDSDRGGGGLSRVPSFTL